jgi:hypothetical protein
VKESERKIREETQKQLEEEQQKQESLLSSLIKAQDDFRKLQKSYQMCQTELMDYKTKDGSNAFLHLIQTFRVLTDALSLRVFR